MYKSCSDVIKKTFVKNHHGLLSFTSVKPSMPETTALGAAMAAGAAEGVGIWSLNPGDLTAVTCERFEPQINPEGKTLILSKKLKLHVLCATWQGFFAFVETSRLIQNQLFICISSQMLKITFVVFGLMCISLSVLSSY